MKKNISKKVDRVVIRYIVLTLVVLCILFLYPKDNNKVYILNYYANSACMLICIVLLLNLYVRKRLDVFEPITIISIIYIIMYFFTPLYDMKLGEYTWFGYDLFAYGVKATIIEFIGFIVFYL